MVTAIRPPDLVSSRPLARDLMTGAPHNLAGQHLRVEFGDVLAAAPSFVDELIRIVLVERRAARLELCGIQCRPANYARRSARTHNVVDRLVIGERQTVGRASTDR